MRTINYYDSHYITNPRVHGAGTNVYTIKRTHDPSNKKVIQAKGFWTPNGGWFRLR